MRLLDRNARAQTIAHAAAAPPALDTDELGSAKTQVRGLRQEVLALRQFIDSMQDLLDATEKPRPQDEIMDLLKETLAISLQAIGAGDGALLVLDEDTGELVFAVVHGEMKPKRLIWRRLPPGAGIAGWVVEHGRATIVNDAQNDKRFYPGVDAQLGFRTDCLLAAPVVGGGRVLGVIEVLNKHDGMVFNAGDQTLLTLACRFAGELLYSALERGAAALPSRPVQPAS